MLINIHESKNVIKTDNSNFSSEIWSFPASFYYTLLNFISLFTNILLLHSLNLIFILTLLNKCLHLIHVHTQYTQNYPRVNCLFPLTIQYLKNTLMVYKTVWGIYRNMWNKFSSIIPIMCFHNSVSWYPYSTICSQWKHDIKGWRWRQNLSSPT